MKTYVPADERNVLICRFMMDILQEHGGAHASFALAFGLPSGGTQDLGHSFFQYGPPGQWKTDILFSTLLRWKGLNVYNKESSRYPNPRIVLLCLK